MNLHGKKFRGVAVCSVFAVALAAHAGEITGTVTNKTTGKPASGDDVVLLSLSQGMQETSRTTTDKDGRYHLPVPDEGVQHLVRVVHGGVNYHTPAPQGTNNVDMAVYDSAQKVDKIFAEGHIFRVQTGSGQLQVSELYILRNESTPPRTQMSDHSFEVTLPEGAQVESGMAAGPGGMPVTSSPVPTGSKNHYAFVFPVRPGRTQFQITYHLPYKGDHTFQYKAEMPTAEVGVMLPKTMKFAATGDLFQNAADESGLATYVAKSVSPGQTVSFTVSGEGTAPREAQGSAGGAMPGEGPGGGLGAPVKGEDALHGTTGWYALGAIVVVLAGGAFYVSKRGEPRAAAATVPQSGTGAVRAATPVPSPAVSSVAAPVARSRGALMDVLKEELFQIETERMTGKMSAEEYETVKAGLAALLKRQMDKG